MKAILDSTLLAESNETVLVEGNHYFPPESLKKEHFTSSDTQTTCSWKGKASYYILTAEDKTIVDGAWYYPNPSSAAQKIKDHVAFGSGINVVE